MITRRISFVSCCLILLFCVGCGGGEEPPSPSQAPTKPAPTGEVGSLLYRITYEDPPPQRARIDATGNPECKKDQILGEKVVVNENKTLRDVVISVGDGPGGYERPAEGVVIDQFHCRYEPHVITARVDETVKITDSDPGMHNVRASRDGRQLFNLTTFQGDEKEVTFEEPGVVFLECNIHPWMEAWVYVTEHGQSAVTGPDGEASLEGLPTGEYTFEAWHEKFGAKTHEETIRPSQTTEIVDSRCCAD